MPIEHEDLFAALAAPFEPHEVKTRQQGGRDLCYVTARTIMNRLDDVVGPANWEDVYFPGEHSVMCTLKITLPDGRVVAKSDAGGYAGMSDDGDDSKSGFSDGFKRAAAKFGCGRYLYRDGVPEFVRERLDEDQVRLLSHPTGAGRMNPEPARSRPHGQESAPAREHGNGHQGGHQGEQPRGQWGGPKGPDVPRSGKALFALAKELEQKHGVGVFKKLNAWASNQGFPARIVDFDTDQVALAFEEVNRIMSLTANHRESR